MVKSKYKAKKKCMCLRCGGPAATFDSLTEADYYWTVLKPLLDRGEIKDLAVHPRFKPGGVVVKADFAYTWARSGERETIDVKANSGHLTNAFKRNRTLVKTLLGIDIKVVQHGRR